jgi:hypothetical protein
LNQLYSVRGNLLKRRGENQPDQLHKRQKSLLLEGVEGSASVWELAGILD